jgi:hypothetical protein
VEFPGTFQPSGDPLFKGWVVEAELEVVADVCEDGRRVSGTIEGAQLPIAVVADDKKLVIPGLALRVLDEYRLALEVVVERREDGAPASEGEIETDQVKPRPVVECNVAALEMPAREADEAVAGAETAVRDCRVQLLEKGGSEKPRSRSAEATVSWEAGAGRSGGILGRAFGVLLLRTSMLVRFEGSVTLSLTLSAREVAIGGNPRRPAAQRPQAEPPGQPKASVA